MAQPIHVRSVSLPSKPQPIALKIEEEIKALRTLLASSSYETPLMMSDRMGQVSNLYESIEMVICLPSNQQAFSKKWVEKELDQSIKVLDLCNVMRDYLSSLKEQAQELGMALRRKESTFERKLNDYTGSRKKALKDVKKCYKSLIQTDNKVRSISTLDKDCYVSMIIRMLIEVREITISLLASVISSILKCKAEAKDSKWSFLSKASRHRKVASCEDNIEHINEAERFEELETGFDCLIKRLIQNRVSLLNILSL